MKYMQKRQEAKALKGVFGNLGMYASGIPVGLLVDSKGPRPGVFLGSLALGSGYYALHRGESYIPKVEFCSH